MSHDLDRLDSLVGELLYYTRLDANDHLDLQRNRQAQEWLQEQIDEIAFIYPEIRFERVDGDTELYCDFRLMSRAVTNLLGNAARYSSHRVSLSFNVADGVQSICVNDDGPGIPIEQRAHVFKPFERLDSSRNRRTGGHARTWFGHCLNYSPAARWISGHWRVFPGGVPCLSFLADEMMCFIDLSRLYEYLLSFAAILRGDYYYIGLYRGKFPCDVP